MIASDWVDSVLVPVGAWVLIIGFFVFAFWTQSAKGKAWSAKNPPSSTKVVTLGMLSSKAKTKRVIESHARRGYVLQSMSDNRGGFAGRPVATLVFRKK